MSDQPTAGHHDALVPARHVPARWLTDHVHLLPASGDALDLACGRGRHALWLAARGFTVHAVDRDEDAIASLREEAARQGLEVAARILDLERPTPVIAASAYDVIVGVHYLHRPLFPQIVAALRPGGVLVYETFTVDQAAIGKPTNPDFLLRPGELPTLVAPLELCVAREGAYDGRMVASVVARRALSDVTA